MTGWTPLVRAEFHNEDDTIPFFFDLTCTREEAGDCRHTVQSPRASHTSQLPLSWLMRRGCWLEVHMRWSQLPSVPVCSTNSIRDIKGLQSAGESSMWWPGLSRQLEDIVKICQDCPKTLCKDRNHLDLPGCHNFQGIKLGLICLSGTSPHTCL